LARISERSYPRTVLVTGATGFTGGKLARELAARGLCVRALVRPGGLTEGLHHKNIELVWGQLTSAVDVVRAAEGVETIYHIAAAYRTAKQPDSYYFDVNVGGTEHVLAAAQRHGVARVVHCSTVGVHGHVRQMVADETTPFNPGDVYQESKLAGEKLVWEGIASGVPATIVRPTPIYGPGDTRLLKLFRLTRNGTFWIFGRGEVHYHLVYIDDLVNGLLLAGEAPAALGEAFIIAGPQSTSLNELAQLVANAVGVKAPRGRLPLWPLMMAAGACEEVCRTLRIEPPLHRRRADFFVKHRSFSIEKARRVLGYQPVVGLEEGLWLTAQWYASKGLIQPISAARLTAPTGLTR